MTLHPNYWGRLSKRQILPSPRSALLGEGRSGHLNGVPWLSNRNTWRATQKGVASRVWLTSHGLASPIIQSLVLAWHSLPWNGREHIGTFKLEAGQDWCHSIRSHFSLDCHFLTFDRNSRTSHSSCSCWEVPCVFCTFSPIELRCTFWTFYDPTDYIQITTYLSPSWQVAKWSCLFASTKETHLLSASNWRDLVHRESMVPLTSGAPWVLVKGSNISLSQPPQDESIIEKPPIIFNRWKHLSIVWDCFPEAQSKQRACLQNLVFCNEFIRLTWIYHPEMTLFITAHNIWESSHKSWLWVFHIHQKIIIIVKTTYDAILKEGSYF